MVTRQLQVKRRTGKEVRRRKTDVLPPCWEMGDCLGWNSIFHFYMPTSTVYFHAKICTYIAEISTKDTRVYFIHEIRSDFL